MYLFNIFADLVDSRGILGQVWFIVLISVLAFCVLIVGLFVCIYMCKTNVTKRFLKNQLGEEASNKQRWDEHTVINQLDKIKNGDLAVWYNGR